MSNNSLTRTRLLFCSRSPPAPSLAGTQQYAVVVVVASGLLAFFPPHKSAPKSHVCDPSNPGTNMQKTDGVHTHDSPALADLELNDLKLTLPP